LSGVLDPLLDVRAPFLGSLIALTVVGCGAHQHRHVEPQAVAPRPEQPPLPSSSIAALLEHQSELALSVEQLARLGDLDRELAQKNIAARREAEALAEARGSTRQQKRSEASSPSVGAGGMGGMGGGRRGGGRRGGGMGRPRSSGEGETPPTEKSLERRLDDNDTEAYQQAEAVLDEPQRERAREIAERYREELFDRRSAE
jgi:hypothetical protein